MYQPPETTYTPNGSQYEPNQSFTMLSQRFQEFTSFQSQYYRMACLPPLQASATPSELMTQQTQLCFILRIHQCRECEESEETCLLSQFPAQTSSAVVSHISFLSPAWLSDSGRVFCISLAPGSGSVLAVQCSVSLFSLANSV